MERVLEQLLPAIKAARSRRSQKSRRLPPTVHETGYVPQHGITCVMHASPSTVQTFSVPLLQRIAKDPALACFLPVPAAGHHVTLLGLEHAACWCDAPLSRIVKLVCTAQQKLNLSLAPFLPISFVPSPQKTRAGLDMQPSSVALLNKLRACEEGMKTLLKVHKNHPQSWHLTLRYFKPSATKPQKAEAQKRLRKHVLEALRSTSSRFLSFGTPKICIYTDHTRYAPFVMK